LPSRDEYKIIKYQLIKSSTSSGANYNEAQAATTKADFHNKTKISLREMIESNYWLTIIDMIVDVKIDREELKYLIKESEELLKILSTIANKTKK
jgi:four helix bundle protein